VLLPANRVARPVNLCPVTGSRSVSDPRGAAETATRKMRRWRQQRRRTPARVGRVQCAYRRRAIRRGRHGRQQQRQRAGDCCREEPQAALGASACEQHGHHKQHQREHADQVRTHTRTGANDIAAGGEYIRQRHRIEAIQSPAPTMAAASEMLHRVMPARYGGPESTALTAVRLGPAATVGRCGRPRASRSSTCAICGCVTGQTTC
jgi:hypothetical protein